MEPYVKTKATGFRPDHRVLEHFLGAKSWKMGDVHEFQVQKTCWDDQDGNG